VARSAADDYWHLYEPRREFERQGCGALVREWVVAPPPFATAGRAAAGRWALVEQDEWYSLSPTYPRAFVLPAAFVVADDDGRGTFGGGASSGAFDLGALRDVLKFRSKGRVPALTWLCAQTGATLCRSSQPRSGFSGRRCAADEARSHSTRLESHARVVDPSPHAPHRE
jgi:hypothetical protein